MQKLYIVREQDNVGTAVDGLKAGSAVTIGAVLGSRIEILQDVQDGHKVALRDIEKGEKIVKYGAPIGEATRNIGKGAWVHLHNMKSCYDERSSSIDAETGVVTDTIYE